MTPALKGYFRRSRILALAVTAVLAVVPAGAFGVAEPLDAAGSNDLAVQRILGAAAAAQPGSVEATIAAAEAALGARAGLADTLLDPGATAGIAREQANLAAARRMLAVLEADYPDANARSIAVTHAALELQAAMLGIEPVRAPARVFEYPTPSAALVELLARYGQAPEKLHELAALDRAEPLAFRTALTWVLNAFLDFDAAARAVYGYPSVTRPVSGLAVPGGTKDTQGIVGADEMVDASGPRDGSAIVAPDLAPLYAARADLFDAAQELQSVLDEIGLPAFPADFFPTGGSFSQMPVFFFDFARANNLWTQDIVLHIDHGAADTPPDTIKDIFRNNAGGNIFTQCSSNCPPGGRAPAAALITYQGRSLYNYATSRNACGLNGGGCNGAGFLFDGRGDDIYTAGSNGTNGGASGVGPGMCVAGNAACVGASGGLGFLFDESGNDTYTASSNGTNGGGVYRGVGALIDTGGNNTYTGLSYGVNGGGANEGVGLLLDDGGNGSGGGTGQYAAESGGVNGGGWNLGAGFLIDSQGSDLYEATNGGTNGGGGGLGTGFLLDTAGNDSYIRLRDKNVLPPFPERTDAGHFATNGGGGYLGGVGFILDGAGTDTYSAGDFAANGGGVQGVGMLLDAGAGSDTFRAGKIGSNGGAWGSGPLVHVLPPGTVGELPTVTTAQPSTPAGVGFLLDGGGSDTYTARPDGPGNGYGQNGGGGLNAAGLLFDAAGNDSYNASIATPGTYANNGGAVAGAAGLLLDAEGNDTYRASSLGANGGGLEGDYSAAKLPGAGLLFDVAGTDTYFDDDGGTGTDKTVRPKGRFGAQMDGVQPPTTYPGPETPPAPDPTIYPGPAVPCPTEYPQPSPNPMPNGQPAYPSGVCSY